MMGLKMVDEPCGSLMTLAGFRHGVLIIYANNDTSVSQVLPPLAMGPAEAEAVLKALDGMLSEVEVALGGVRRPGYRYASASSEWSGRRDSRLGLPPATRLEPGSATVSAQGTLSLDPAPPHVVR